MCPAGRPGRTLLSRSVTLRWMVYPKAEWWSETVGIDVTRDAESIFEGISSPRGLYIPPPETTLMSRSVTRTLWGFLL